MFARVAGGHFTPGLQLLTHEAWTKSTEMSINVNQQLNVHCVGYTNAQ